MTRKKSRRAGAARKRGGSGSRSYGKLPKDRATHTVILRPRDGQEIFLEAELRALVGPTRKEDGCLRYDLYRSAEDRWLSCCMKSGNRGSTTRHTPRPTIFCAGMRARIRC